MKKIIAFLLLAIMSTLALATPTLNGAPLKGVKVEAEPRAGNIIITNKTKYTIKVIKMWLPEGGRNCDTRIKATSIKPGETVELPEGEHCGIYASSEVILATPNGLIKQTW